MDEPAYYIGKDILFNLMLHIDYPALKNFISDPNVETSALVIYNDQNFWRQKIGVNFDHHPESAPNWKNLYILLEVMYKGDTNKYLKNTTSPSKSSENAIPLKLANEGTFWINNENFGTDFWPMLSAFVGVKSKSETLMARGYILRWTLDRLFKISLQGREIDSSSKEYFFNYTDAMKKYFGEIPATYDTAAEEQRRGRVKIHNDSNDSVLDVLKRSYGGANIPAKFRIRFSKDFFIDRYLGILMDWITLSKIDLSNDDKIILSDPEVKWQLLLEYKFTHLFWKLNFKF